MSFLKKIKKEKKENPKEEAISESFDSGTEEAGWLLSINT